LPQDAPKLKWVNLNHSKKLNTLAGLGKAQNLQELNLEGCTALKEMHVDMENMKFLVFLNLRGSFTEKNNGCFSDAIFGDIETSWFHGGEDGG
jgi:hypothetical protein